MHHRETEFTEKRKEEDCGDSFSVSSESSVVKTSYVCRRHALTFMQRWGLES